MLHSWMKALSNSRTAATWRFGNNCPHSPRVGAYDAATPFSLRRMA
jgi:hypothetical protein